MMIYSASFDVSKLALGTLTLSTAGKPDIVLTLPNLLWYDSTGADTPRFFHFNYAGDFFIRAPDPAASLRFKDFAVRAFHGAMQVAMQLGATAQGWTGPTNLTFTVGSAAFFNYVITYTASVTAVFSASAGAALLGYSTTTPPAGTTITGDCCPMYVVTPTLSATSENAPDYEPGASANHEIADDGTGYGTKRGVTPLYRDWLQQFEVRARTERRSAIAAHPYTLQQLFEDCRGQMPFAVQNGFGATEIDVFSFRSEGTVWKPQYAAPGYNAQLHVPFKAVFEAVISAS